MKRLIAVLLIASLATPVHAGLVGNASPGDRERLAAHLNREDVAAELASRGITREEAQARVAALTDAEAASLAGRIDELPAGGFVHVIAAMGLVAPMIPVLIGVAVVGAVVLAVGAVAGVKYMARHGDAKREDVAAAPPAQAARPSTWKVVASRPSDPGTSPFPASGWYRPVSAEFGRPAVDASAFPVSTGLYGAVILDGGK